MSRSQYHDDLDDLTLGRWRGMVASAIRGKRGQKLLRDTLIALDAMPEKALVVSELETKEGDVCTLGALGRARGIDMKAIDPEDPPQVAAAFDIAECLAQEIAYENDEGYYGETPGQRWHRMRTWVANQIKVVA